MIFLKIGAWPNAYKKKVDEARVSDIFETLLSFSFETLVKAEFIFLILFINTLAKNKKIFASKFTEDKIYNCSWIFNLSNSFFETTLIVYFGYLVFHHLLIAIASPFKSFAQIGTHNIFDWSSLWNNQLEGEAIKSWIKLKWFLNSSLLLKINFSLQNR